MTFWPLPTLLLLPHINGNCYVRALHGPQYTYQQCIAESVE